MSCPTTLFCLQLSEIFRGRPIYPQCLGGLVKSLLHTIWTAARAATDIFADIEKIYNKRMYGNGVMRARLASGETKDIYRFTFAVAGPL